MKYQIKGSTVTFTNRSVNTADVTSWKWWLDEDGGGFTEITGIPSPDVSADITFPNTAGILCTVRLTASGPWGADIVYEEQYTTVENIAPPEVDTISITAYPLDEIDIMASVVEGTGAGELTWEIIGSNTYGLSVNTNTGRITGYLLYYNATTTGTIALKVTDALGRSNIYSVAITANATNGIVFLTDLNNEGLITMDGNNKISSIASAIPGLTTSLTQSTATHQPTLANDGVNNYIKFVGNIGERLTIAASYRFFLVLQMEEDIVASLGTRQIVSHNPQPPTHALGQFIDGLHCMNTTIPHAAGSNKFLVSVIRTLANSIKYCFIDGIWRNASWPATAAASSLGAGSTGAYPANKIRVYDVLFMDNTTPITLSRLNGIRKYFSAKWGINTKSFVSTYAGGTITL